jgi:hypothetical protein
LLGGFFGQDVPQVGVLAFDFSGTGEHESFFGSRQRFHFWHTVVWFLWVIK